GAGGDFGGLAAGGGLSTGWTHVVATGRELLFYRTDTGDIATGRLGTDGNFAGLATGRLSSGWTHVVATDSATVRVMTQNMYMGNPGTITRATPETLAAAVAKFFNETVASNPAQRAAAIA